MWKETGSYRTYSSLVKLQPRFLSLQVEDLPLGRIAALVSEFAVKDLPLGRTLMMMITFVVKIRILLFAHSCVHLKSRYYHVGVYLRCSSRAIFSPSLSCAATCIPLWRRLCIVELLGEKTVVMVIKLLHSLFSLLLR